MRLALLALDMLVCSDGSEVTAALLLLLSSSCFWASSRNCLVIPSSGSSGSNTVHEKESRVSLLSNSE